MRLITLLAAFAAGAGMLSCPAVEAVAGTTSASGAASSNAQPEASSAPRAGQAGVAPVQEAPAAKPQDPNAQGVASSTAEPSAVAAARPAPTPPAVVVRVNLTTQKMDVSVSGKHQHSWSVSSGRAGYPTPRGSWRAQWTARMWHSRKYDNAPMPHSIFFTGGYAIHATSATGMLGRPASHGCIRLAPANAATLYGLVQKHGTRNAQIQVFGTPPVPQVAERRPRNERRTVQRPPSQHRPVAVTIRPDGLARLPAGSPYTGRESFVHNGVKYVRIR
jgi:lipoprotein-anchoring transpeptidase ErfK/SrfK